MFTMPALLVFISFLSAFLGKVLQIIQQYVKDNLQVWAVCFYVFACVFVLLAVLELVFGIRCKIRRAQAHRGTLPPKRHKRRR